MVGTQKEPCFLTQLELSGFGVPRIPQLTYLRTSSCLRYKQHLSEHYAG